MLSVKMSGGGGDHDCGIDEEGIRRRGRKRR
jgi:hypothetical protein